VVTRLLADIDREDLPGRKVGESDVEAHGDEHLVAVGDQRRGPRTPPRYADHRVGRVPTGNLERKGIGSVGWIGMGRRHGDAEQCEQHGGGCRPSLHLLASLLDEHDVSSRRLALGTPHPTGVVHDDWLLYPEPCLSPDVRSVGLVVSTADARSWAAIDRARLVSGSGRDAARSKGSISLETLSADLTESYWSSLPSPKHRLGPARQHHPSRLSCCCPP
jgi:hypothetical protein